MLLLGLRSSRAQRLLKRLDFGLGPFTFERLPSLLAHLISQSRQQYRRDEDHRERDDHSYIDERDDGSLLKIARRMAVNLKHFNRRPRDRPVVCQFWSTNWASRDVVAIRQLLP